MQLNSDTQCKYFNNIHSTMLYIHSREVGNPILNRCIGSCWKRSVFFLLDLKGDSIKIHTSNFLCPSNPKMQSHPDLSPRDHLPSGTGCDRAFDFPSAAVDQGC